MVIVLVINTLTMAKESYNYKMTGAIYNQDNYGTHAIFKVS